MNKPKLKLAPSKEAVVRFLNKEPKSGEAVLKSFFMRSVLIGAGILALGDSKNIVRNSLASSMAIQVYLLWFYQKQLSPISIENSK